MTKKLAPLLLPMMFFLTTVCYSATKVSITNEAFVTGPYITLGDIAEISGDDAVRVAALKRIHLGSAPAPGARISLSRDILTTRLSSSQTDFNGVEWGTVPDFITITSGGQVISGQSLAETAIVKIKNRLPKAANAEFRITLLQEIPDLVAPLGIISYDISGPTTRLGVAQTLHLLISADGVQVGRVPVKCEIRRFASVLTVAENIVSRGTVTAESVRVSKLDTSRLPAGYLQDPAQAVGFVVTRSLPTGSILYSSYLEKPVLIKRGTPVLIFASVGGVEVTASGIAQANGHEGQGIYIRNSATGKLIIAHVVDRGRVEVVTQ